MTQLYYIGLNGQQYGPYELEQVKNFGLLADTLVFVEGGHEWKAASEYPELAGCYQENAAAGALDIFNINYYYKDEIGELYGPFSIVELAYLDITETTLLGINSAENLHYASEIEGLVETLARLAELDKEEYDAEMQKIKDDYAAQLEEQRRKAQEIELDKQELKEVIEEQEKELLEREREIERLKNPPKPKETLTKELLLNAISEFKGKMQSEERRRFSVSYPSLSNELLDKVEKYNDLQKQFIALMNFLSEKSQLWLAAVEKDYQLKNEVMSAVRNITEQYYKANAALFPENYETAETSHAVWNNLQTQKHNFPTSTLLTGKNVIDFALFGELFSVTKREYATLLDTKNIVAYYDKSTRQHCFDFINTLTGRLFMSSLPRKFQVTTIDTQEMEGISDTLKSLNKLVFIYSRENEVRQCFEKKTQYIENVIQNLLLHPVKNIGEYNQGKENPEGYQLLIIKAFPIGLREDSLSMLKQIMKNGLRAGIHAVLLIDKDELAVSENAQKMLDGFDLGKFNHSLLQYDFTTDKFPFTLENNMQHFLFENLELPQIQNIVRYVNKSLENRPPEVASFANFIPGEQEWWSRNSASRIEIPFGVSEDKELVSLAITQESGENSAVVIGVPGSGKSVFLHAVISNSILNYSPDELELYLMDFSGVEFNTYALRNLPHAKVIAPEAEREFGLSVLRELKEEGSRRMELCRNNEVSNIVDLRAKCPDMKIPRQLVIIDEFQKLFEIETDSISKEAMSIIHIIIKEFRKFGINLILATQKLADINSSILPKDLIANRVVFKCSPSDIGLVGMNTVPQLRTGECIYNSELGVATANRKVQTFFISKKEIDALLNRVKNFDSGRKYEKKNTITFRSNELPDFKKPDMAPQALPDEVNLYFGAPIAIMEDDVFAGLKKQSNDNVLIIGGEPDVAQKIAINTPLSIMAAHTDRSAKLYFFNFMRPTDALYSIPATCYNTPVFETVWASKAAEVTESLQEIKAEIDARIADENREQSHIYLSFYAFQMAQVFKKGGRRGEDVSEAGQLLAYILNKGTLVGVFTVLQVDNVANLQQIGDNSFTCFAHRVALQMDDKDSQKIVGSEIASKLYIMNRPSSKYRAYYFNNRNRILVKFKPYKLS
ncbi:MAG: GYF domain-containing protein [Prevotellaceae bacterium]|nr:GYF domain-containing protein [Prevotellaceae bacterium]